MNATSALTFPDTGFSLTGIFPPRPLHAPRPKPATMRAAAYWRYGGPEEVAVVNEAVPLPAAGQLRIRVQAAAVNPLDWKLLRGDLRFLRRGKWPRGVGRDFAGVIDAVGEGVTGWRSGEPVLGSLAHPLADARGAMGDFVVVSPDEIVRRPPGLSAAAAAALPIAGASALECLRLGEVGADSKVLVLGATGGVGSYVTAFGSQRGAQITAACRESNAAYALSLGAREIVWRDRTRPLSCAGQFDAIIDPVGTHPFWFFAPWLKPRGRYVTTVPGPGHYLAAAWSCLHRGRRARALMISVTPAHLAELANLSGSVVDRVALTVYPLEQIPAALLRSRTGPVRGKLVIDLAGTPT